MSRRDDAAQATDTSSWPILRLDEVAEINPRTDKSVIPDDLPVSFVPMPAVGAGNGAIDVTQTRPAGDVKKGFTAFRESDVLFAKITPCMENGKMAVVPALQGGYGFGSTEFHVLRPKTGIDPKYLYYYVSSQGFRASAERQMTGAVGQRRVPTPYLKECTIPVAPPSAQKRIVAEIEKQFSRLDEGVANLNRVKANLKRYKAAVLKAAVEGRLVETEAALAHRQRRSYEDGKALMTRILGGRSERSSNARNHRPPVTPVNQTARLPDGWTWATVDQLAVLVEYGSSAKTSQDSSGIPVLRMGNISDGQLLFDDLKYLPATHDEFPKLLLKDGDLLFNRTNSPELVGKTSVFRASGAPYSFASYLIRVRLAEGIEPEFIAAYINSLHGRSWVKNVVTQQVGQANVNGTKLRGLTVPLPPSAEQRRIVAELERATSLMAETESRSMENSERAIGLRQSILSGAFNPNE